MSVAGMENKFLACVLNLISSGCLECWNLELHPNLMRKCSDDERGQQHEEMQICVYCPE